MSTCQPFSIMRLTHEGIRAGLNHLEELNTKLSPATTPQLKAAFGEVKRVIELHANQEDNAFYPPLEKKQILPMPLPKSTRRSIRHLNG